MMKLRVTSIEVENPTNAIVLQVLGITMSGSARVIATLESAPTEPAPIADPGTGGAGETNLKETHAVCTASTPSNPQAPRKRVKESKRTAEPDAPCGDARTSQKEVLEGEPVQSRPAVIRTANATETPAKDGCVGSVPKPSGLNPDLVRQAPECESTSAAPSFNTAQHPGPSSLKRPKPGMLSTPAQQRHFASVHGAAGKPAASVRSEVRKVKPGEVLANLRTMQPGDEFIVFPAPRKLTGISTMIRTMRRAGTLDGRVCVSWDQDKRPRVIFHREAVKA